MFQCHHQYKSILPIEFLPIHFNIIKISLKVIYDRSFTLFIKGDIKETVIRLNSSMSQWKLSNKSPWWTSLSAKCTLNRAGNRAMVEDESVPLNYYTAFDQLERMIPENATIVSEGANTMDIGRTMMNNR